MQGGCQPVCDGHLANQTNPSTCFFPVKEGGNNGLFMYTNDNTKLTLVSKVDGNVWDTVNAASYASTNHSVNVSSPYVEQFHTSNWNFMMMSPIGDGFAHPADHTELSWYMLEVVD